MTQVTSGIRAVLSNPRVYNSLQWLMSGHIGRTDFARHMVRAEPDARILDIGCGTADILNYLPATVGYCGWDVSESYVAAARSRFGDRGEFVCGLVQESDIAGQPPYDVVIASALLHHMDDDQVRALARLARLAVRDGGRFVTIDPVLTPRQHPIARYLITRDRGQHVRDPDGYVNLVRSAFRQVHGVVRHRRWVPYTHWMMEATSG